jgi:hypothetical protein
LFAGFLFACCCFVTASALPHSTPLPPHIAVSVAALVDRAIMLPGSRLAERRHESVAAICSSSDACRHRACLPITACDNFSQRPACAT